MEAPHFTNSPFSIRHFIVNLKGTPDGQWVALYSLMNMIENKYKVLVAQKANRENNKKFYREHLRQIVGGEQLGQDYFEHPEVAAMRLQLAEIEITDSVFDLDIRAAKIELDYIVSLMDEVNPHCEYKDQDVLDRIVKVQQTEWYHELRQRLGHYTLQGLSSCLPHDQAAAMLAHPDIGDKIYPMVKAISKEIMIAWSDSKEKKKEDFDSQLKEMILLYLEQSKNKDMKVI